MEMLKLFLREGKGIVQLLMFLGLGYVAIDGYKSLTEEEVKTPSQLETKEQRRVGVTAHKTVPPLMIPDYRPAWDIYMNEEEAKLI